MTAATKESKRPELPPEEKFWQRYSAHHEFPLAGVTSFFIHALVIGVMVLAAFWYLIQRESETNKPPSMDVVQLSGGGDGSEGAGGEPGLPGDPNPMTEVAPNPMTNSTDPVVDPALKEAANVDLNIPEIGATEPKIDVDNILENVGKDAADTAKKETIKKPAKVAKAGTGNPNGSGGSGGSGGGLGKGKQGQGSGVGGPGGRKATKAEIYAFRWRFDLTGNGKEHVNKLAAFGVTLAIPTPDGKYLFIQDLRRRPVDLQPGNMDKFKDAVKWQNTEPASLRDLAAELQLPFVPARVIMLLPSDREQKMAAEEMRFAQRSGRPANQIRATFFDFRLRDGVYEPLALRQE